MSYPNIFEFQEDFEKGEQILGKGTYGTVYKKKSKRIINSELENANSGQGQYFAVKMMEAQTERSFATIQKEFLILRSLPKQHPNIIKLYKTYAWANQLMKTYTLMLVMELADKSLMREIEERSLTKNYFQDDELHHIFYQCIKTLNDIKQQSNIYHRDIKPENILLIKSGFQIKIADFGVSKKLIKEKLTTIAGTLVGTPSYLSPVLWEAFQQGQQQIQKINKITHNLEKSDVFSLGVTLLQTTLLTCDIQHLNQVINQFIQRNIGEAKTSELLKQVQNPRIKNILGKMLIHDEKLRAPYSELLNLLGEPIPKQLTLPKKPIFSYVEPKQGIKEKFSLQAKLQYDKIEQTQQESEESEINNKAEQPLNKDDGSQNQQTQQIQRSEQKDQEEKQQQQEL